ncbi:MAG: SusD/RagB family nutrient-binding outer membrane lipoprotein [Bacteroidales bacterium]|jgi:hypothetical protein|nr:SusD/RagB family nutrient-binding outer membrane lipoprotein [Bacteroidales bacterium]
MKNIVIPFIIAGAALLTAGCTKGFDEMNTPSTSLTKESLSPELLLGTSINKGTSAEYQRNYNLYDDMYAHYLSNCEPSFSSANYVYNDSWASCGWEEFYTERQKEYNDINDICGDQPSFTNMKAINDIWNCFLSERVTDRWGDVPYSGSSLGDAVAYASQEDIYKDLLKRLKKSCSAIGSSSESQFTPGTNDLLYKGNAEKWKKFGYSLMLRMAMRISNVDPEDAENYAKIAIAGGTMTSIDDVAKVKCDLSGNGYYDYYNYLIVEWRSSISDRNFMNYMRGGTPGYPRANTLDPRTSRWFLPGNDGYVGFRNGMASASYPTDFNWEDYACINYKENGYFYFVEGDGENSRLYYPVMNYAEVLFLKSEAALRGWGGDAENLYEEGIKASMEEVSEISGNTISDSEMQNYINGLPSWSAAASKEQKLKLIAVQKWIAVFPNSCEGWSEFRRTGYPDDLDYPEVSSSASVQDGNWIQRISYPFNEYSYNDSNIPEKYRKGSSSYTYREQYGVWWSLCGKDNTLPKDYVPQNKF